MHDKKAANIQLIETPCCSHALVQKDCIYAILSMHMTVLGRNDCCIGRRM